MTVLASLRGGHVDNLAGAVLDHHEAILSQGRALHWESGARACICYGIERMLMLTKWSKSASKIVFYKTDGKIIVKACAQPVVVVGLVRGVRSSSHLCVVRHLD